MSTPITYTISNPEDFGSVSEPAEQKVAKKRARMAPRVKTNLAGLKPEVAYRLFLKNELKDNFKYKYNKNIKSYVKNSRVESEGTPPVFMEHHEMVKKGKDWMARTVDFSEIFWSVDSLPNTLQVQTLRLYKISVLITTENGEYVKELGDRRHLFLPVSSLNAEYAEVKKSRKRAAVQDMDQEGEAKRQRREEEVVQMEDPVERGVEEQVRLDLQPKEGEMTKAEEIMTENIIKNGLSIEEKDDLVNFLENIDQWIDEIEEENEIVDAVDNLVNIDKPDDKERPQEEQVVQDIQEVDVEAEQALEKVEEWIPDPVFQGVQENLQGIGQRQQVDPSEQTSQNWPGQYGWNPPIRHPEIVQYAYGQQY